MYEAVERAGGNLEDADLSCINLAYILSDGQKIYIPKKGEIIKSKSNQMEYVSSDFGDNVLIEDGKDTGYGGDKVNINTANQTELETLPGIGPSTALKIINYRKENGKYKTIEDIKKVSGIGDSKYNKIKELIKI